PDDDLERFLLTVPPMKGVLGALPVDAPLLLVHAEAERTKMTKNARIYFCLLIFASFQYVILNVSILLKLLQRTLNEIYKLNDLFKVLFKFN
ncbi:MAG: hypothetical protein AABZ37_06395, partial [Thermoproteota archaeon]